MSEFITTAELFELLGVSPETLARYRAGGSKSSRERRYRREDVEPLLATPAEFRSPMPESETVTVYRVTTGRTHYTTSKAEAEGRARCFDSLRTKLDAYAGHGPATIEERRAVLLPAEGGGA